MSDHQPQRRRLLAGAALLAGTSLSGCGGGDDVLVPPADSRKQPLGGVDSGGTGAPMSFFSAAFDAVAPLTVGTVQIDTTQSTIVDGDGQALADRNLQPGMTGQILASRIGYVGAQAVAQASSVRVSEQLLGPVQAVAAGAVTALGQRIVVTSQTLVDASLGDPASLPTDAVLRVWGQLDVAGARIVATRIERAAAPVAFVVRGVLARLDRANAAVTIGGLDARATDTAAIAADVEQGSVVRARLATTPDAKGWRLLSLRSDGLLLPDRVEAEIEGRVTRWTSRERFAVDGVEVDASQADTVQGAAWLALGAQVGVHGRSSGGRLIASSVQVEPEELVQLEGAIAAADAPARTFLLRGTLVAWNEATAFEGGGSRLLMPRRRVSVLGRWSADRSRLQALHIHVEA